MIRVNVEGLGNYFFRVYGFLGKWKMDFLKDVVLELSIKLKVLGWEVSWVG